jgi:hypothetical protein
LGKYGAGRVGNSGQDTLMKLLFEVIVSLILHPLAVILLWINLAGRSDLSMAKKLVWGIVGIVWGLGPILYILVADGQLW